MSLFFLVVFSLYGGLHYYLYSRAVAALTLGIYGKTFLGAFFALMVLAPLLTRLAERQEWEFLARNLAWGGYTWMGFAFLCFSLALAIDLYRLLLWLPSFWFDLSALIPSVRTRFLLPCFLALLLCIYGFFAAQAIRVEHLEIATDKLAPPVNRLRIALISDVHLGILIGEKRLAPILAAVREAKPDLLISLGDLVDGQMNHIEPAVALLAQEQFPLGKYAIMGNHEYFVGPDHSREVLAQAGFTLLCDQVSVVGESLILVGIDDPIGRRLGFAKPVDERTLLAALPRDKYILLLKHQPYVKENLVGLFDLQLSGHTHRGQIFPFYLLTHLFFSRPSGWYDLGGGSSLYVSRGTGTWGPPIRVLASPEVTVIDFVRK